MKKILTNKIIWLASVSLILFLLVGFAISDNQARNSNSLTCPSGMFPVYGVEGVRCFDAFEASPSVDCPVREVANYLDTELNISRDVCGAASEGGVLPWTYISRDQAVLACESSGKRLPTAKEWYQLAIETNLDCNISSGKVSKTGEYKGCVSNLGAYDMLGNVWEWVSDSVYGGYYDERLLPDTGYVANLDGSGMAVETTADNQNLGYFWSNQEGEWAVIRGGFYGSRRDAGLGIVHAATGSNFFGPAVGFRCVI
jgi:hypothetical protein